MLYRLESTLSPMSTTYGDRLERALQIAGRDRQFLADRINISVQAIGQVIGGKTKALTAENSAKAARVLGVDSYWLATGDGDPFGGVAEPPAAYGPTWPFRDIDEQKVRALNESERNKLEGAILVAAGFAGLDIRTDGKSTAAA